MYKIIRMTKRRKDLSLAQFKDYWLTRHAQLHRKSLDMAPVRAKKRLDQARDSSSMFQ